MRMDLKSHFILKQTEVTQEAHATNLQEIKGFETHPDDQNGEDQNHQKFEVKLKWGSLKSANSSESNRVKINSAKRTHLKSRKSCSHLRVVAKLMRRVNVV